MFTVWSKLLVGEKLISSQLHDFDTAYSQEDFRDYIFRICYELDIPSPMVLPSHVMHFTNFNNTKFRKSDFVEKVDFDTMVIENCIDTDKKKTNPFYI